MQKRTLRTGKIAKMQNVSMCPMSAEGCGRAHIGRIKIAKCISDFNDTLCAFDASIISITAYHKAFIHHKRASHYVVLGEISDSPFTAYIIVDTGGNGQVAFPFVHIPCDIMGGLVCQF